MLVAVAGWANVVKRTHDGTQKTCIPLYTDHRWFGLLLKLYVPDYLAWRGITVSQPTDVRVAFITQGPESGGIYGRAHDLFDTVVGTHWVRDKGTNGNQWLTVSDWLRPVIGLVMFVSSSHESVGQKANPHRNSKGASYRGTECCGELRQLTPAYLVPGTLLFINLINLSRRASSAPGRYRHARLRKQPNTQARNSASYLANKKLLYNNYLAGDLHSANSQAW